MAFLQSEHATRVANTATAGCAGVEVAQMFEIDLGGQTLAAGDTIELGILPAYNRISGGYIACGDTTLAGDIGIMSGDVGDEDPARLVGDEIAAAFVATSATAVTPITALTAFEVEDTDKDRSIGFKVTTGATLAAGVKLQLLLKYRAV